MSDLANYRHSASVRAIIRALIPVVCPSEHEELGVADAVVFETEEGLRAMPSAVRLAIVAGLTAYDLGAVARYGRRARKLRGERALAYFRWWMHGLALQREFAQGIKGIIGMAYAEQPAVLERIGYTPKAWIARVHERRLEQYSDEIAAHEATIFERDPIPLPSEVAQRVDASVQLDAQKKVS